MPEAQAMNTMEMTQTPTAMRGAVAKKAKVSFAQAGPMEQSRMQKTRAKNPPAPKVLGRDLPDGTRKRLQVYLGGGIFRPKPCVFDRS